MSPPYLGLSNLLTQYGPDTFLASGALLTNLYSNCLSAVRAASPDLAWSVGPLPGDLQSWVALWLFLFFLTLSTLPNGLVLLVQKVLPPPFPLLVVTVVNGLVLLLNVGLVRSFDLLVPLLLLLPSLLLPQLLALPRPLPVFSLPSLRSKPVNGWLFTN